MKGLVIFSHNMEDVEALATRALLVRAGFEIVSATFESTLVIKTAFGLDVKADTFIRDIKLSDFDLLIIPGGRYVGLTIKDSQIPELAKYFANENKVISAICAGPRFLGKAGLLNDTKFTAFPGSELDDFNGYRPSSKAYVDQNIITARGAGAVYEFAYQIIKYFFGEDRAKRLLDEIQF